MLFWQIMGQGLKLGPINFIDELSFIYSIFTDAKKINLSKVNILVIFGFWIFLNSIFGYIIYFELSSLRMIFIGLLIMLFGFFKLNKLGIFNWKILFFYPLLIILINVFELLNLDSVPRYWHQEWLWSGTAYSSFGLISIVGISAILFKNKLILFALNWTLSLIAGILTDSRTTILFISIFLLLFFLNQFSNFFKRIYKFSFRKFISFFLILLLGFLITDNEEFKDQFESSKKIMNLFFSNDLDSLESDAGRYNQFLYGVDILSNSNLFNMLFGYGSGSHKFKLLAYQEADGSSLDRQIVRPVGISAILIDSGLLFIFFTLIVIFLNIYQLVLSYNGLYNFLILINLIFITILITFITNLSESMLFYFIIFPNSISNELQKIS